MWLAIKIIGFTAIVPGIEAILIPSLLANGRLCNLIASAHGWYLSGWLPVCFGLLLYALSVTGFAVRGFGTPAPFDPPKHLVVAGVHAYTRNPMYVGIVSFVIGLAILCGLWRLFFYGVGLFVFFHVVVRFFEEPVLKRNYGLEYEEYCKSVPRWEFRTRPYFSEKEARTTD